MPPIFRKASYYHSFVNFHRIGALRLTIHQGLIFKSMQHSSVEKFRKENKSYGC